MSDIICLKLVSGEELAGKLKNNNGDTFVIRDVASIVMMPSSGNQVSLGLMTFCHMQIQKNLQLLSIP
jgi:hypothetical protein